MNAPLRGLALATLLAVVAACAHRPAEPSDSSKRADVHAQLGASYLARNQFDVALKELELALAIDSSDAMANHYMALLQDRLKNPARTEEHFKRALRTRPDYSEALHDYGMFLCAQGRYDDALARFKTALQNPLYRTPELASLRAGECALRKPDRALAEQHFRQALARNPRLAPALYHMAQISFDAGQALSARGYLQRYFEVAKDSPQVLLLAVKVEKVLGGRDAQASYAVRLRGKFPDSDETKQLDTLSAR